MKREELEQIAKMAGAMLVYNPHGGPIMADNLDVIWRSLTYHFPAITR